MKNFTATIDFLEVMIDRADQPDETNERKRKDCLVGAVYAKAQLDLIACISEDRTEQVRAYELIKYACSLIDIFLTN